MTPSVLRAMSLLAGMTSLLGAAAPTRTLTFEDRVRAQTTIERLYYEHQIGTTKPFEEAIPRTLIERKVRNYLAQTAALEKFWKTPLTAEALRLELGRMARDTRLPGRLEEMFLALGNDSFLIQESIVRPALAARLTDRSFRGDMRIHGQARAEADSLRSRLTNGTLSPLIDEPHRTVTVIARGVESSPPGEWPGRVWLDPESYQRTRETLPRRVLEAGPVADAGDSFTVQVILEERPESLRLATYSVAKIPRDVWWASAGKDLGAPDVRPIASSTSPLPAITGRGARSESEATEGPAAPLAGCTPDNVWDNASLDDPLDQPVPRTRHTAVWTGSLLIVWGGTNGTLTHRQTYNAGERYDPVTDTWGPTSTVNAPVARSGHTAVWTGEQMIVWGGDSASASNTGGRYDPVADSWTPTSTLNAPMKLAGHAAVWTGSEMIIWGGTSSLFPENTGGRYNPVTDTWVATSLVSAPEGSLNPTAVWSGAQVLFFGGQRRDTLHGFLFSVSSVGRYDPVADQWLPMSSGLSERHAHTAVWSGTRMLVWGGACYGGSCANSYLGNGASYDPVDDSWSPLPAAGAPSSRSGHTAIWTGSRMIVWGGENGPSLNSGGIYDPGSSSWSPMTTNNAPVARSGHTATWSGSVMIIWGGNGQEVAQRQRGRYDPATDQWVAVPASLMPGPREGHTAVWTGNLMIVWGGNNFNSPRTGGRYDPALDAWTPMSIIDAPASRTRHIAVWTGDVMVIWGGDDGASRDTGGRYDPAANTWAGMAIAGAPIGRSDHSAVWTGSRVIIWGGTAGGPRSDGALYDPAADQWTAITNAPAESARTLHTAIWTGSEMISWGGNDIIGAPLNDGWRFDPSSLQWRSVSTADAPAARSRHSAVWTGTSMLIWAGQDDSATLNTGGSYDPKRNRWTALSTANAPPPRVFHTTVWTGGSMVVWGGRSSPTSQPTALATGGRYDPAADAWTPTSMLNAPSPRVGHSAVWTGSLMIVWGGITNDFTLQDTGGRYGVDFSADADEDGYRVFCDGDCDDTDPGVFASPQEVPDVTLQEIVGGVRLTWASQAMTAGSGTVYDVYTGLVSDLVPAGDFSTGGCLSDSGADTSLDVLGMDPPSGDARYFMVRAQNACPSGTATYGSIGRDEGASQSAQACQ